MKRVVLVLGLIILVGAAGALFAFLRLDAQSVRDHLAEAVRSVTGKPLLIKEMPTISFMPLGVKFGAVAWGTGPDGKPDANGGLSVTVKSGQVSVEFLPLLSSRVVITEVRLDSPEIRITPVKNAPAPTPEKAEVSPAKKDAPPAVEIDTLAVTNALIDMETDDGRRVRLSKLNTTLYNLTSSGEMLLDLSAEIAAANPALEGSVTLKGKAQMRLNRCDVREFSARYTPRAGLIPAAAGPINVHAKGVYDLAGGKASVLSVKLETGASSVELSGEADVQAKSFAGKLDIAATPRKLATAFGVSLPLKRGLENFKLQSPLSVSPQATHLGEMQGMLDATSLAGKLSYELAGRISGNLRIGAVDVDALTAAGPLSAPEVFAALRLGPIEAFAAAPASKPAPAPAAPAKGKAPAGSLPAVDLDLAVASVTVSKLTLKDIHAKKPDRASTG